MSARSRPRLENFTGYHAAAAQIWEQQALTRARVVAGDPELGDAGGGRHLGEPRPAARAAGLGQAIRAMRERIFKEHGSADPWNLKHAPGGMVETEFAVQHLKLLHAAQTAPGCGPPACARSWHVIREEGLLPPEQAQVLQRGFALASGAPGGPAAVGERPLPTEDGPAQRLLAALVRVAAVALEGEPPPADFAAAPADAR